MYRVTPCDHPSKRKKEGTLKTDEHNVQPRPLRSTTLKCDSNQMGLKVGFICSYQKLGGQFEPTIICRDSSPHAHYFLDELVPFVLQMIHTSNCDHDKQEQTGNDAATSIATEVAMTSTQTTTGNDAAIAEHPQATMAPTDTTTGNDAAITEHPQATTAPTDTTTGNDAAITEHPQATTAPTDTTTGNDTAITEHPQATTAPTDTTTGMNTTSSSTSPTTGDFCNSDTCGTNLAKCVALHSTSICLCQYGFYYDNKDCHKGKIFPGVITVKESYTDSVQTVNSVPYEKLFQNVTKFFEEAFSNLTGFAETVIVEIQPQSQGRASPLMSVTVTNLFMENSTENNETVSSAIRNAINGSFYVSQYRGATYCAVYNCDARTTVCEESMFPKCICRSGFTKTEWDDRSCSDCSKDCSEKENKYCVNENGLPVCKCMPNFEEKKEKCVSCPVGYSGENCKNNSELILIIVGTVFGAIILSLVIAVSVVSVRAKHRQDPEKKRLIKSGYSNPNGLDDRQTTIFPRVQTTSGHANPGYQPNNPYEMHSSNRGRPLERDYDDLYETSRGPEGFRMQSRY
ncbi:mucin-13 [Pelecanus crispus]